MSYAEPNSTSDEVRTEDSVKASQRRKIDKAGIFQVLKYEELCGRDPMEMRANNPGYDIKSFNQSGQLERLIEVKSISGEWGESGVKLTDTQYQKNLAEGDRFWLYVVERATETNFKIYCIKNPASHITDHCFDYVWKFLDEQ